MLKEILKPDAGLKDAGAYLQDAAVPASEAIRANATYFGNMDWAQEYLDNCHRDAHFRARWLAAGGDWSGKVVIDLGCGPGNVFATVGGRPRLLVGVDVADGALALARAQGYEAVMADAAHTPFRSGVADIVVINASLHHCDDMQAVLREGARLVKAGGLLITDHDPQLTAWDFKGPARWMWDARLWIYRVIGRGFHKSAEQQSWGLRTEIHHRPGDGVTAGFFRDTLLPLGFDVRVHAHNHQVGAQALDGMTGPAEWKYRVGQLLSGRRPGAVGSALSLMCIARRHADAVAACAPGQVAATPCTCGHASRAAKE